MDHSKYAVAVAGGDSVIDDCIDLLFRELFRQVNGSNIAGAMPGDALKALEAGPNENGRVPGVVLLH